MVTFLVTSLGDPTHPGSEGLELTPGEPVIGENFANSAGVLVKLEMFKHSFSYLPFRYECHVIDHVMILVHISPAVLFLVTDTHGALQQTLIRM